VLVDMLIFIFGDVIPVVVLVRTLVAAFYMDLLWDLFYFLGRLKNKKRPHARGLLLEVLDAKSN
jgi:hypothetical protein